MHSTYFTVFILYCDTLRTIEENVKLCSLPKSKKKFNVSHQPLFSSIPLVNVVIDNLHLFLRVSDVLVDLLLEDLLRHDALSKATKVSRVDPEKHKHITAFEEFVHSIGIPRFSLFVGADSKVKWRTFTGEIL